MIRVLTYEGIDAGRGNLRLATEAAMSALGSRNHGVVRVATPDELVEQVLRMRPGFFGAVVCRVGADADGVLEALRAIHDDNDLTHLVVIADDQSHVQRAVEAGASAYCLALEGIEGLKRGLARPVERMLSHHGGTVGLRFDMGVGSLPLDDVVFAESTKKGSLIHLVDGSTRLARTTLQALFDKLAASGVFEKAGNSFIVNLDNVRSTGDGAVIFSNGESIVIPVRVRKPMRETLAAYGERS